MLLNVLNPPRGRPVGGGGVHRILCTQHKRENYSSRINQHYLLTKSLPNSDA